MKSILFGYILIICSICSAQPVNQQIKLTIPANSEALSSGLNPDGFPRVFPDNSVIFKVLARQVSSMAVVMNKNYEMTKDQDGVWSVTTEPLEPGFHYYTFLIDGVRVSDHSGMVYYGSNYYSSGIEIPEKGVDFYDIKDVPHGEIRSVVYFSKNTGTWRPLNIYTPFGYDGSGKKYPVLYIQHGGGENEQGWVVQGKTANILDNLISGGLAKEMLVVISNGNVGSNGYNAEGMKGFRDEMIENIIPFIEGHYRVVPDAAHRAMAGLSMGGGQTFYVGLANPDVFSYVGIFSSGVFGGVQINSAPFDAEREIPGIYTDAGSFNSKLNLLYISVGEQDPRIEATRKIVDDFRSKGLEVEFSSFPGGHEWQVWRKSLHDFAQRLFKD
jgi:enterochelin esterase family protein